jgi:hypothetical protein
MGAFFQLTVDLIGVFDLCSYIVPGSNRVLICVSPYVLFGLDGCNGTVFSFGQLELHITLKSFPFQLKKVKLIYYY